MNGAYALIWLLACWKWGDWKNWQKYYSTLLFFIVGDFIYLYLLSDLYPMWRYTPQGMDKNIGLTNTHVSLSIMFIKYTTTIFIYLSKFPNSSKMKQVLYMAFWVLLYTLNEIMDLFFHLMKHYNGWNLGYSILFNVVMFVILRVHHSKPPIAWGLSILFIIFLWNLFDVPSSVFR